MIRLGVAVRVFGRGGLCTGEERRVVGGQHLSVRLLQVRDVLRYLVDHRIACYRLADDLLVSPAAVAAVPIEREFDASRSLLRELGAFVCAHDLRLTVHLGMRCLLSAQDAGVAAYAAAMIMAQARLLEALGMGSEGTIVAHVGGACGDPAAALQRFAARFERLPVGARGRLAIELESHSFGLAALLRLHGMVGVPVVLDVLHFQLNNPERMGLGEALGLALATWPRGVRPKVHFSTQRTEGHVLPAGRTGRPQVFAPRLGHHADFINPFEFAALLVAARGVVPFDVMLEAKAADLALLRLRADVQRFAPEVAGLLG